MKFCTVLQVAIIIILSFGNFAEVVANTGRPTPKKKGKNIGPRIWVQAYLEPGSVSMTNFPKKFRLKCSFKNDFLERNGTDFVIFDVNWIYFVCEAQYPVEWTVPKTSQLSEFPNSVGTTFERYSIFNLSKADPQNRLFKTILRIGSQSSKFFSVGFTCTAINAGWGHRAHSINIHVYKSGEVLLENQGKTVEVVYYSPNEDYNPPPLVLPCRPALPDMDVTLEVQTDRLGGGWQTIQPIYYSFDPKIGFTFPVRTLPENSTLAGLYRCRVNDSEADWGTFSLPTLLINVTESKIPPNSLEAVPPHSKLEGNATVWVRRVVRCCTGISSIRPNMFMGSCSGPLHCKLLKELFQNNRTLYRFNGVKIGGQTQEKDCVTADNLPGMPSLVACSGKNVDYFGLILKIFRPGAGTIPWRNGMPVLRTALMMIYKDVGASKAVRMGGKALVVVGHSATTRFPERTRLVINTPRDRVEDIEIIEEYGRNVYYEGEPLRFVCLGLKYFYSDGARLWLNWKNGTRSVIDNSRRNVRRELYFYSSSREVISDSVLSTVVTTEVKAEVGMSSVDCFMPPQRNGNWKKFTYALSVFPAVLPKFENAEDETIYLNLHDGDKKYFCRVVEGLPVPEVQVIQNGALKLRQTLNKYGGKSTLTLTIEFKNVTHDEQGDVLCIAENLKGRVVKTFKFFILEKSRLDGPAIAAITVVALIIALALLIIGLGVKYRSQERAKQAIMLKVWSNR